MKKLHIEELVRSECNNLYREHGVVNPKDLVDRSRPDDAPLHDKFEWDEEKAAEEYRLWQARELIARVNVKISGKSFRGFINVNVFLGGEIVQGYVPTVTVMSDQTLRDQAIAEALREIEFWKDKYKGYKELEKLINTEEFERVSRQVH